MIGKGDGAGGLGGIGGIDEVRFILLTPEAF